VDEKSLKLEIKRLELNARRASKAADKLRNELVSRDHILTQLQEDANEKGRIIDRDLSKPGHDGHGVGDEESLAEAMPQELMSRLTLTLTLAITLIMTLIGGGTRGAHVPHRQENRVQDEIKDTESRHPPKQPRHLDLSKFSNQLLKERLAGP